MTNTNRPFSWKDRDTFAYDLMQIVYHAPSKISERALQLLEQVGSTAVVPQLHVIVLDENWPPASRVYALRGIIESPDDVYIPEIREFLDSPDFQHLTIGSPILYDALRLAYHHASNESWLLDYIEQLPLKEQQETLCYYLSQSPPVIASLRLNWHYMFCDHLVSLMEKHPALMDLGAIALLYRHDDRDTTQVWLDANIPPIVEMCLEAHISDYAHLLDEWEILKQCVFAAQPELVDAYASCKANMVTLHNERRDRDTIDLTQSNTWRTLTDLCDQIQEGDEQVWRKLVDGVNVKDNVLKKAAAVHFFGKLTATPAASRHLLRLLKSAHKAAWIWKSDDIPDTYITHYPVLYEVCDALAKHPSPTVWQALLNVYFARGHYARTIGEWIVYQTDRLSGIEKPIENYGHVWQIENRIWFKALVETERDNP